MENFLIALVILAFILLLAAVYSLCFSKHFVTEPVHFWGFYSEDHREYISLEDIDPMQESGYYHQINNMLPKISYLLSEYKIFYADVITNIHRRKIPAAFIANNVAGYIDWTLLKKYVVDCEIQWYNLINEFEALCADHQLANAVRSSFKVLNKQVKLTAADLSDIRFDVIDKNQVKPVYVNGDPMTIPRVVARCGGYFGDTFEEYMPDYRWHAPEIATAIRYERQLLDEKLSDILQLLGIGSYAELKVGKQLI